MHVYVKMRMETSSPPIPIHYNYLAQSAIYAALPEDMAARIHDEGFAAGKRSFKMFAFSRLMGQYTLDKTNGTITFPGNVLLVVASPDLEFFLSLSNNLLTKNRLRIGPSWFLIEEVRFDEQRADDRVVTVRTLSPVVVYSTLLKPEGGKYTCYYQPGEGEFDRLLTANLGKKYEAFHGGEPPVGEVRARPLDRPRLHVTSYKNTVVKGYTCRLKLSGPQELLQMALDAGLGGKGSQGYGCVEKVERPKKI
ncbi:MAG TPA: CRISPR-associated endoribonuclease Cas6 [Pelotomaculum sp.]|nr:CRISPR-associated endoribonuclease Cas6 [Pelotomaculum sp.]